MTRKVYVAAFLLVLLGGMPARVWAAIFTNGGFSTGGFNAGANPNSPNDPGSEQLLDGSTDITGWTVFNSELAWIGLNNLYGIPSADADQFSLDFTGYTDDGPGNQGGVSQVFDTVAGNQYRFTFAIGAHYGSASVSASVGPSGGALTPLGLFTSSNPTQPFAWQDSTFVFTASTTLTQVDFMGNTATSNDLNLNGKYIGFDNVRLNDLGPTTAAVPEPATIAIWGLGAFGFAVAGYRRRKQVDWVPLVSTMR